jgi:hypothetical protein
MSTTAVIVVLGACLIIGYAGCRRGPLLSRSDLEALINATREAKGLTPGRDPQEACPFCRAGFGEHICFGPPVPREPRDPQEPRERLWHPGCRRCLDELIEIELRAGMAALDKHLKDAL